MGVGILKALLGSFFRKIFLASVLVSSLLFTACATKVLFYEKSDKLEKNDEFEKAVEIYIPEPEPEVSVESTATQAEIVPASNAVVQTTTTTLRPTKTTTTTTLKLKKGQGTTTTMASRRQPELESDIGFQGRRPIFDPFRVGEKVVHAVTYLKMLAGYLTMEVRPFATVNGKKSYNLFTGIKTSSFFSSFYSVDDHVTTLLDYDSLVPSVFKLSVKETSQIKEAQSLFDWESMTARYWEKKVTKRDGEQESKMEWEILPYSQNIFSIAYYLRVFQWDVGSVHEFRVADDNENLVFKATALRKQKIKTEAGEFNTIVIRPEMSLKGQFKPMGDNFIFLTDDDRKLIVRIESKIKIGSLVSEAVEVHLGK